MSTAMRKKEEGVYESQPEKKIQLELLIFVSQMQILQLVKSKVRRLSNLTCSILTMIIKKPHIH